MLEPFTPEQVIEDCASIISGCTPEEVTNYYATAHYLMRKLPFQLAEQWEVARRIAVKGSNSGEKPEKVNFSIKVKCDQSNLDQLNIEISTSLTEGHKSEDGCLESLRQLQLFDDQGNFLDPETRRALEAQAVDTIAEYDSAEQAVIADIQGSSEEPEEGQPASRTPEEIQPASRTPEEILISTTEYFTSMDVKAMRMYAEQQDIEIPLKGKIAIRDVLIAQAVTREIEEAEELLSDQQDALEADDDPHSEKPAENAASEPEQLTAETDAEGEAIPLDADQGATSMNPQEEEEEEDKSVPKGWAVVGE
jgi:hypothetical protein